MPTIKWTNRNYVAVYQLAKAGTTKTQAASTLGVSKNTLKKWLRTKPALQDAWDRGRSEIESNWQEYIFQHLSQELHSVWHEIMAVQDEPNAIERIDAILHNKGKRARQNLFVHALVSSNFNMSQALRQIGLSRNTLEVWKDEEKFSEMLDEIHWHKKNFFESALLGRVASGDTAATIYCAKTKLRDRGYGDTKSDDSSDAPNVFNLQVNIDAMHLPIEQRRTILTSIENGHEHNNGNGNGHVQPRITDQIDRS